MKLAPSLQAADKAIEDLINRGNPKHRANTLKLEKTDDLKTETPSSNYFLIGSNSFSGIACVW